jgi:hypothetical protein
VEKTTVEMSQVGVRESNLLETTAETTQVEQCELDLKEAIEDDL